MGAKALNLNPTRHVYFSRTEDNPYLPPWYIEQLKEDLDPKLALRMLYGQWVEINSDVIYHAYSEAVNYRPVDYEPKPTQDIYWAWDFNIGEGKPLSNCFHQNEMKDGFLKAFHFYAEVVVDGASTEEACQDAADRGLLDVEDTHYIIRGDATGGSRSTKSKSSDYDIIRKFLANYRTKRGAPVSFEIDVPKSNPPVRTRHNLVNAYCKNDAGKHRLFVYKGCPTINKGMKLSTLKKGGSYIEDDSKPYQHITTALGYSVVRTHSTERTGPRIVERQIR